MMKLLYSNFDGLDVSFQGAFPEDVLSTLAEAKERAKASRDEGVIVRIGRENCLVSVASTGAKGGYAYRFDTGIDGATWFVKNSTKRQDWNIRVSVKSLNLALNGYETVRDTLLKTLDEFGVCGCWYSLDGDLMPPEQSVSRADYCFDFLMDDFEPTPERFVVHSQCTMKEIETLDLVNVWRAKRIETIMLGKMPGRQVTLYDKIREIMKSNKPYWWDLWGIKQEETQGRVWRVEVRAGKNELREWNVGNFFCFEFCVGNIIQKILQDIRYVTPTDDTNPSRWPCDPMWAVCQETAKEALAPYTSNAERKKIIKDLRENVVARAQKNFRGAVATYNHLLGHGLEEVAKTLEVINEDVQTFAENEKAEFRRKLKKAEEKYIFLDEKEEE